MRRATLVVTAILLWGIATFAFSIHKGLGPPDTRGWCPADWLIGCTSGTAALDSEGLHLLNLSVPPRSAYELELKLLPYRSLLFSFESEQGIGHVIISLDGVEVERVAIETGSWWLRLDDLPPEGTLRVEVDDYCESLLIRSVYFPCRGEGPVGPECKDRFLEGLLWGMGLTVALLLASYVVIHTGE